MSLLPSIAWKVNNKLSIGATVNAMYGIYKDNVAINNVDPRLADGQLKLKDETWGWGANLGLLYEFSPETRLGFTWNSQANLDFNPTAEFQGLSPLINAAFAMAGLLNATVNIGIKVPQGGAMASLYTQLDERWALLGSVGWQQWSRFGQMQVSIDDSTNPKAITANIPLKDTWHVAAGAQYRVSDPWLLNFGIACDSEFQPNNSQISPLMPLNAAWRFGVGGQRQLDKARYWGCSPSSRTAERSTSTSRARGLSPSAGAAILSAPTRTPQRCSSGPITTGRSDAAVSAKYCAAAASRRGQR
jgi:long-chain fatty acid transport protein